MTWYDIIVEIEVNKHDFHEKFLRAFIPLDDIAVRQPINATIIIVNGSAWINKREVIYPHPPPQIISAKLTLLPLRSLAFSEMMPPPHQQSAS
jgi:hypothetical protein